MIHYDVYLTFFNINYNVCSNRKQLQRVKDKLNESLYYTLNSQKYNYV